MRQTIRQLKAASSGPGNAGIAPRPAVARWQAVALLLGAGLAGQPAFAATFNVDSTADAVDLTPGDGVCAISLPTETVRDEFSSNSYSTNAGTQNYSAAWFETGESDGVGSGRLRVLSSGNCAAGSCFRIGGDEVSIAGRSLTRQANLSGAVSATLSYNYRRQLLEGSGGSVRVEASNNGGSSFSLLTTINLNGSDGGQITVNTDVTSFIASNTQIRFLGVGSTESYLYVDNIQIQYTVPGDCTLRAAVQEANALGGADTINVPAGNYVLSLGNSFEDNAAQGDLDLNEAVTINGAGLGATTIDGNADFRPFEVRSSGVVISDLTVANGNPGSGLGGGIFVQPGSGPFALNRVSISGNDGNIGAGVHMANAGVATFTDVTVSNNSGASEGGGIYLDNGTLIWTGGTLANHVVAGKGAGIHAKDASLTLTNVTVSANTGADEGGGIFNDNTTTVISGSTFVGNEADKGGGINTLSGNVTVTNSTFSSNTSAEGASVRLESNTTTLTNVTIASSAGDGIYRAGGTAQARNTIVYGSSGSDCSGGVTNLANNLDGDGTCSFGLTADPRLGSLANNGGPTQTRELLVGSPAVDAGTNTGCPATDQRGNPRPVDGDISGTATCDIGAFEADAPAAADLTLAISDAPDPAPLNGPLVYSLLVTNNGPGTASGVVLTSTLPASVTFVSSTASQGSCSGTTTVTCNLGAILNGGTASVEIQVVTNATGSITNNASVTADQPDPVPGDNSASANTTVTTASGFDVPLTQFVRMAGFLDYEITGSTLRTQPNSVDSCAITGSASAAVTGIPATGTVRGAYLYWAGSGAVTDSNVTLDGAPVAADRTFESDFVLAPNTYEFFGGFADVTAQVVAKRNGLYTFGGLTVDNGGIYCSASAVIAGWSLLVIYEDTTLTGKTLVVYDGFDLTRNGSTSYLLSGIYVSAPTEARTSALLWDGDEDLGGTSERLMFNSNALSDALNPANNVYNSTINSLGSNTSYGMDFDSFDVSGLVSEGDTLATLQVDTGPDLVILNTVVLQAKTNVISGTVFEDVNYGGGAGRDLATSAAAAPSFTVPRPGAVVELYDNTGVFLRTTTTNANGDYGFSGLPDGDYQVRAVNDTVQSSRPGGGSGELGVQTYRVNGSGASVVAVAGEVGGASPALQDAGANGSSANLGSFTAQSVAPVTITASITKSGVDFGYNFDTIVNGNSTGQGSLAQFITNANTLGNANLAQDGLTAGTEHSLFMIPSNADPLGRAADPNFDAGRGVAAISVAAQLPAIVAGDTTIDGTLQTTLVGDTNAGQLGTGGTVGVDGVALGRVDAPEIEITPSAVVANGLRLQADDLTVRGLALFGFGTTGGEAAVLIADGVQDTLIEGNLLGSRADVFADPGAAQRGYTGIHSTGGDNGTVRNNLLGFEDTRCLLLDTASNGWTIENNEFQDCGLGSTDGDGVAIAGSNTTAVTGNLIDGSSSQGIVVTGASGATFTNNTITGNGVGTASGVLQSAGATFRPSASNNTFERNVVSSNYGAGVQINDGATGVTLTRNHFVDNGTITSRDGSAATGQIGIDLNGIGDDSNLGTAPFVTPNDSGDGDAGGNALLNYPVIATAINTGPSTVVTGSLNAAPGTNITLEFFSGAGLHPSGHGNAEQFRGTDTVLTDGSGNASFTTVLPVSVPVGHAITITSTDGSGNTSELSANGIVSTGLEIVKRAFFVDGTPIPNGSTLPDGVPFYFLLYVSNPNAARADLSLQDVLDPAIAYDAGTIRVDNSVAACAGAGCTPAEESNIYAAVVLTAPLTDAVDGDVASYSGGTRTVDIGNQNAGNAQLDIAANRVYALLIRVRLQ
ncbi:MAG: right-handed parallel beta-helix repeat-containing protein [Pseudomonadota bacterium]